MRVDRSSFKMTSSLEPKRTARKTQKMPLSKARTRMKNQMTTLNSLTKTKMRIPMNFRAQEVVQTRMKDLIGTKWRNVLTRRIKELPSGDKRTGTVREEQWANLRGEDEGL